jgi:hypothetical protein
LIEWKRQGTGIVGVLSFSDGRQGNVVLVGPWQNAKGATLVMTGVDNTPQMVRMDEGLALLHPSQVMEIMSMQEREFGDKGLSAPKHLE